MTIDEWNAMDAEGQSKFADIKAAFDACMQLVGTGAPEIEARTKLQILMAQRHTWFGDQYKVCFAAHNYLNGISQ